MFPLQLFDQCHNVKSVLFMLQWWRVKRQQDAWASSNMEVCEAVGKNLVAVSSDFLCPHLCRNHTGTISLVLCRRSEASSA